MSIEIEPAVDSDLDEILSLVNKVVAEWFIKIIPKEHYKEPFLSQKQFNQMAAFMEFFVIRREDQIIAVGSFSSRDENKAWIPLMHVQSKYQRMGIGSSLMRFLENKAKSLNYTSIQLETDSEAEWAINFYTKHGYSVFQKDKNPWGYHVWLEKLLS
ncbi:MAG: GNAT family N-acetyltransferase [Candidatus Thorarchaeota archaeon]